MTEATLTRDEEIKQIHEKYRTFYQLGGGLLLVLIGVFIGAVIFSNEPGYGTNIYTELLSVTLTIGVLNVLQERRDTRNRTKDLQEQLVREAGSSVNAIAVSAVNTMTKRGWLGRKSQNDTKSLLENVDLSSADLRDANLHEANLMGALLRGSNLTSAQLMYSNSKGADLRGANLTSADLFGVNLSSANLGNANLTNATLVSTNLTSANLFVANLTNAYMQYSNLSGANLENTNLTSVNFHRANLTNANLIRANLTSANLTIANLNGVNLSGANLINADLRETDFSSANLREADITDTFIRKSTKFDENTILPDGSNWSEGRDLGEFGAETREIVNTDWDEQQRIDTYTFGDGTKRRWKRMKGWLDDRDGNPIEDNT